MTGLEIILIVLCACLSLGMIYLIRLSVKLGKIIIDVEDALDDCFEAIDNSYHRMSQILEKPVFFDSVEVRQVIQEIIGTRNVLLAIANAMAASIDETAIVKDDNEGR